MIITNLLTYMPSFCYCFLHIASVNAEANTTTLLKHIDTHPGSQQLIGKRLMGVQYTQGTYQESITDKGNLVWQEV